MKTNDNITDINPTPQYRVTFISVMYLPIFINLHQS